MYISNNSSPQADGELARFTGIARTWFADTNNILVKPEAAARAIRLAEADRKQRNGVRLWPILSEHAPDLPMGWVAKAEITADGLYIEGFLDVIVPEARKAFKKAREGKSNGLSLGFTVLKEHRENGVRVVEDLEIFEISVGEDPVDRGAWLKSVNPFTDIEYSVLRAIRAEQRSFMTDDERKLADLRASLLGDAEGEEKMANYEWVDDDGDDVYERPLYDHSPRQEPDDRGYRIEYGREDESRSVFERELRKELREADPELYELVPGGKAQQRLIAQRQQERTQKQLAQKAALEADRKERAEGQAAMAAETFTPDQFAAASGLGADWCKRYFRTLIQSGRAAPVDEGGQVLRGQDVRNAAKRDHEAIEAQALTMRNKRLQGGR